MHVIMENKRNIQPIGWVAVKDTSRTRLGYTQQSATSHDDTERQQEEMEEDGP